MDNKPNILAVIQPYVELRRLGKELVGLCPLHSEKHPSFTVNESKNLFYCFGYGAGGDAIRFIELAEGLSFKEACKHLSLDTARPRPRPHKDKAEKIVAWAKENSVKVREAMREISDKVYVCKTARREPSADRQLIVRHEASLIRQWAILADLDDDLNNPGLILELWEQRGAIEALLESLA